MKNILNIKYSVFNIKQEQYHTVELKLSIFFKKRQKNSLINNNHNPRFVHLYLGGSTIYVDCVEYGLNYYFDDESYYKAIIKEFYNLRNRTFDQESIRIDGLKLF